MSGELRGCWLGFSAWRLSTLPHHVLENAVLELADDFRTMVRDGHERQVRKRIDSSAERKTSQLARAEVFCAFGFRLAPTEAPVLDAIAGCWCDMDEGYFPAPCHAGLCALPALLAAAEVSGAGYPFVVVGVQVR